MLSIDVAVALSEFFLGFVHVSLFCCVRTNASVFMGSLLRFFFLQEVAERNRHMRVFWSWERRLPGGKRIRPKH